MQTDNKVLCHQSEVLQLTNCVFYNVEVINSLLVSNQFNEAQEVS